ncbi:hypothetical protein [Halocatena marina]|uniref:hypothetical protein n=1 Tax=Halocatena marina TaxID=2934937 RepID=UPI0020102B1A|nr:hypothetical protein [Halocatena marina]
MINEPQIEKIRSMPVPLDVDVPSEGDLRQPAAPIALPCHGPDCSKIVVTHATEEDEAVTPTIEIRRIHPVTGEQCRSTFWFCSEDCRSAFVESEDREVELVGEDTDE